jgi:hypothetical protein
MEEHVFNLYPVANQHELAFSYRLVEVEGDLGAGSDDPDLPLKNLHLLTKRIAFGQQVPVAIVQGGDKPVLAVAADRPFERRDYQLTPHVVSLRPKDEVHQVRFAGVMGRRSELRSRSWRGKSEATFLNAGIFGRAGRTRSSVKSR